MIRVILRLFIILRVISRPFCCCDLSHDLYSSKDPCCSLACGHRRISGRRFSSPKWVERSDDRKYQYVCVRRLAVPKRNNFCNRTLVPWPHPAPVTISSGWLTPFKVRRRLPYTSKSILSSLFKSWYFSKFSSEILAGGRRKLRYLSGLHVCLSTVKICLNLINRDNQRRFPPKCTFWAIQSTFRSKNSLTWGTQIRKIKLKKIVGNSLEYVTKIVHEGNGHLKIRSLAEAIDNCRQFLLLRIDILQKTVVPLLKVPQVFTALEDESFTLKATSLRWRCLIISFYFLFSMFSFRLWLFCHIEHLYTFQMRIRINCLCWVCFLLLYTGRYVADYVRQTFTPRCKWKL